MTVFARAYRLMLRNEGVERDILERDILEGLLAEKARHGWTQAECEDAARWAAHRWGMNARRTSV